LSKLVFASPAFAVALVMFWPVSVSYSCAAAAARACERESLELRRFATIVGSCCSSCAVLSEISETAVLLTSAMSCSPLSRAMPGCLRPYSLPAAACAIREPMFALPRASSVAPSAAPRSPIADAVDATAGSSMIESLFERSPATSVPPRLASASRSASSTFAWSTCAVRYGAA
jgi:hypothetical protein